MICDNFQNTHNPQIIGEDNNAIRVYCPECGAQERIGKNKNGDPNNHQVGEWYKRDFLQPGNPLYYKYAGKKNMNVL